MIPEIGAVECSFASGLEQDPLDPRRKPEPGMLLDAARVHGLDLTRSWMIGDRWRDVNCGARAGVRTVFIDFGYDEPLRARPDFTVRSFAEAAGIILAQPESGKLNSPPNPLP
jgi:D-glycero-D-manno-heptose 1,7-bisphosphate phosphatase